MATSSAAIKIRPVRKRGPHPYWEGDRFQDLTEPMGTDASADVFPGTDEQVHPSTLVTNENLHWGHVTGELVDDLTSPAWTSTAGSVALAVAASTDVLFATRGACSYESVTPWNVIFAAPAFVPLIESVPEISLIQAIKELPGIGEQIGRRLEQLDEIVKEAEEGHPGISPGSLRSFLVALRSYPDLRIPRITLTPDNNIYATWRDDSGQVFSVHFLPDNNARYVILRRDSTDEPTEIRSTGTVPARRLLSLNETSAATWVFL